LLVTPSHHRVHHDVRLHKNFGGTLIIWDRLFDTFVEEPPRPACRFGARVNPGLADAIAQGQGWSIKPVGKWYMGPGYQTSTSKRTLVRVVDARPPADALGTIAQTLQSAAFLLCIYMLVF
jgi:hypothetical protein